MRKIFLLTWFTLVIFCLLASDPPTPQVLIEANIVEVENNFVRELGIEWGMGPTIGHYTNVENPDEIQKNVVGVNAFAGVDFLVNPFVSIFGHLNLAQFGNGSESSDGYNKTKTKLLNLGVDTGIKLHVKPGVKVDGFILMGLNFGVTVSGVTKTKQNGQKKKVRFPLDPNENRAFAGAMGGVGVTVRTDVVDFTLQTVIIGGLTTLDKNPPENTPRSVPFFAEIPIIIRFFRDRDKSRDRTDLIFMLTPELIDIEED